MTCLGCSRGCDGSNRTLPTGWSSHPPVACHPSLPAPCVRNRPLMAGKLLAASDEIIPAVQTFRLTQFPFSLLYINRADYLWVVAVAQGSRKPGNWKQRVVSACPGLENSAQAETSTRRLCRTRTCRPLALLTGSEGAPRCTQLQFQPMVDPFPQQVRL
jgi:hypothetical protein